MNLLEYIMTQSGMLSTGSIEDDRISKAESILNLSFSEEYREYVKKLGTASFGNHELTGICNFPRLNVISATREVKTHNKNLSGLYVIENLHYDDLVVLQNSKGCVFLAGYNGKPVKIADSILEYLKK